MSTYRDRIISALIMDLIREIDYDLWKEYKSEPTITKEMVKIVDNFLKARHWRV